jgi:1-aminocyclopropane-1-carboxylate deaminase/D-cysteine desulfhydrase-like pyridoxal-dependent ACC family enzyme
VTRDAKHRATRRHGIRELLAPHPRVELALLPTPLEPLPRLTAALGGPQILVKRDDLTGLAFGGNKTRQLEYVLGDLLTKSPDVLVTGANIQSNWCRQSAAAAARLGIPIVLVLRNTEMQEIQGNVLLDLWLGADVRFVDEPDMTRVVRYHLDRVVAELEADGRRAIKIDPWAPSVALGYLGMMAELDEQCESMGVDPDRIWLAAAGPTHSGIELGRRLLEWDCRVTGIAPIEWSDAPLADLVADAANRTAAFLDLDIRIEPSEIDNRGEFVGPGYGRVSDEGLAAMRLAARTDALLLDPVYTSKAMAALVSAVRGGELTRQDTVVFLHTGGLPAVFAYRDDVLAMSRDEPASREEPGLVAGDRAP